MNIIQLQEALKDFSDDQLVREMQMPSGQTPQYLVLTELERREKSRQRYQAQQQPQQSVAEETLMTRMQGGIAPMAPQGMPGIPPQSANAPSPMQPPMAPPMQPPMQMAQGGILKAREGMYMPSDPVLRAIMMQESGGDPFARGEAGEIGAFQIMPTTAISPGYNIPSLFPELESAVARGEYPSFEAAYEANKDLIESTLQDPRKSEQFASNYLKAARERFPDDEARAIASYNVGMAGAENLEDPSSFSYVQGVAEKGYSPDEMKTAPSILGISAAQASTGQEEEAPTETNTNLLQNIAYPFAALYDTVIGLPAAAAENVYEYGKEIITGEPAEFVHSMPAQTAVVGSMDPYTDTGIPAQVREAAGVPQGVPLPEPASSEAAQIQQDRTLDEISAQFDTLPTTTGAQGSDVEETLYDQAAEDTADQTPQTALEQLMDMMQQRRAMAEEQAEMDKYLALAQAGATLASSKDPTFLGALGEATQAGIGALQGSREGLADVTGDEMDVMKALAVAEASAEAKGATTQREYLRLAKDYDKMITDLQADIIGTPSPEQTQRMQEALAMRDYYRMLGGLPAIGASTSTRGAAGFGSYLEGRKAQEQ